MAIKRNLHYLARRLAKVVCRNERAWPSRRLLPVRAARGPGIESTEKRNCPGIAINQRLEFDAEQGRLLSFVVLKMPDAISYGGFAGARPKKDSSVEILY